MLRHRTRLTGVLLAALLALSPATASPARADGDTVGRVLLGATTLFIIGSALSRQGKTHHYDHTPPKQPRVHRKGLPGHCMTRWKIRHSTIRVFGRHCLVRYTGHVPRVCDEVITGPRGRHVVFRAHCLERHGYYIY